MNYKIGDKVKIIKNSTKHKYGDIVEIAQVLKFVHRDTSGECFTEDECEFYSRSGYIKIENSITISITKE